LSENAFDLVVIGGGPGGYEAAAYASEHGLSTACVEMNAVGGVCLHRGCIPSKTLIRSAELLEWAKDSADFGVTVEGEVRFHLTAAMDNKSKVIQRLHKGTQSLLKSAGVTTVIGRGRLAGPNRVTVASEEGEKLLEAGKIIVATGSAPRLLPGMVADGERIITSDHALSLSDVPASTIILGAGAIGMEFAYILSTYGSKVTVLELLPRVLPLEDEEISKQLDRLYRKRCDIRCGVKVTGVEARADGVAVTAENEAGEASVYEAEKLLVAVGRRPLSEDLGLEEAGVVVERGYVRTDEVMRTANPDIYAIGDVVGRLPLAHTASAEGMVAVDSILGRSPAPLDYDLIPRATYCHPEAASVGLTEAKAKEKGYSVATSQVMFRAIGKAVASGDVEGLCKLVAEEGSGKLLGVHIIGPHATELIAEAGIALRLGATARDVARSVHAHPTLAEVVMQAAQRLVTE